MEPLTTITDDTTLAATPVGTSLVDLIQVDNTPVTPITVAEAKKNKAVRQDNLGTVVKKLAEFTLEDIASYPISVIYDLVDQSQRISKAYDTQVEAMKAARANGQ